MIQTPTGNVHYEIYDGSDSSIDLELDCVIPSYRETAPYGRQNGHALASVLLYGDMPPEIALKQGANACSSVQVSVTPYWETLEYG